MSFGDADIANAQAILSCGDIVIALTTLSKEHALQKVLKGE